MNFGTFIVILVIAAIVVFDIRYLMKNGIDACKGDCSKCHGSCSSCKWSEDINRAKKEIHEEKQNSLRGL